MSEWGNPTLLRKEMVSLPDECIVRKELTRGTETSKYPEEKKSKETPLVAASEDGPAQTRLRSGVAGD